MLKKRLSFFIPLLFFIGIFLYLFLYSYHQNGGRWIYSVDDAYIHMALSKNIVTQGVWGVTAHEFTSASSSVFWSLILAGFYLIDVNTFVPLILNFVEGIILLWILYRILKKEQLNEVYIFFALMIFVLFNNTYNLIFTGMEHLTQGILVVLFFYLAATMIPQKVLTNKKQDWLLLLIAMLLVTTRYEGAFLVLIACFWFFFVSRRYMYAIYLGLSSLLGIAVFGVYSWFQGWPVVPITLIVKGNRPEINSLQSFWDYASEGLQAIAFDKLSLFSLMAILLIVCLRTWLNKRFVDRINVMSVSFLIYAYLYMQFTGFYNLYFRYYFHYQLLLLLVLLLGAYKLVIELIKYQKRDTELRTVEGLGLRAGVVITILSLILLSVQVPPMKRGTDEIFMQQIQMAKFVQKYHYNDVVAANDIGAISYYTNIHLVDLAGLASLDVAMARAEGRFNSSFIEEITKKKGTQLAIVYDNWFPGMLPKSWIKVGEWTYPEPTIQLGGRTVSFYATNPAMVERLTQELREFSPTLPRKIVESGLYTQTQQ
ncbi:hypothetical protein [Risungbinella massiliensis]|uniref:hypothetical protein n=1 Tax=Risungbinella massiliensis TaxID=1329796 RepID=UPI0005CC3ED3|nr:hypothetical protein [Risungbinella massiliensis]